MHFDAALPRRCSENKETAEAGSHEWISLESSSIYAEVTYLCSFYLSLQGRLKVSACLGELSKCQWETAFFSHYSLTLS